MNKSKIASAVFAASVLVGGGGVVAATPAAAASIEVRAYPVRDAPGGTWGKTCYFKEQKNWNGSITLIEVRERNYWWGKLCQETGYKPTTWAKSIRVPLWV